MDTSEQLRHRKIKNLLARPASKAVDAQIRLWEKLTTQIVSIVGVGGFNSLYTRSLFISQSTFPWLKADKLSAHPDDHFSELKLNLDAQPPGLSTEANFLLLTTFTDILASLIGEQLTSSILHSAWGIDASEITEKELNNE